MVSEFPEKTAFLYIRTSTTDQKNSIELQETQLKEYCRLRGITIKEKFVDFGKSGKNARERPEFMRMMEIIQKSDENSPAPVDMVLCTKLDRFARSLVDLSINVEIMANRGIKFATLTQEFEIQTSTGKLLFNVLGSFAEFERSIINERTREGFYAAIDRGVMCHRPPKDISKKKVLDYIINKRLSATATAKIMGVTPNTIKKRMNDWDYWYVDNVWVKVKGNQLTSTDKYDPENEDE